MFHINEFTRERGELIAAYTSDMNPQAWMSLLENSTLTEVDGNAVMLRIGERWLAPGCPVAVVSMPRRDGDILAELQKVDVRQAEEICATRLDWAFAAQ